MKTRPILTTLLITTSLLLANLAVAGHGPGAGQRGTSDMDEPETEDLRYMREEEKLARDVYLTLDEYWGDQTRVFERIAASEETHTDTVNYLLDKYDVEDPVVNDVVGAFTNPELQALYDQLVRKGANSFIEALYVGALIEEVDMEDIVAAIDRTDERAIILAYSNLLDGSKNHLRAFVSGIEDQGLHYEAQVLDPEEVAVILEAEAG
jgi:hypothetical protein